MILCCSTDESNFNNGISPKRGIGLVRQSPRLKGAKMAAGTSYRNNASRIYKKTQKHPSGKWNVICTICLDFDRPVTGLKIMTEYTDGSIFGNYVQTRVLPSHIRYDTMDRAKFHFAVAANELRGTSPMKDIYRAKQICADPTPAGYPQYDAIESVFGWTHHQVEEEASRFDPDGEGWSMDDLRSEIQDAFNRIDFKMVQGWYTRTWNTMYPGRPLPPYLIPGISRDDFYSHVKVAVEEEKGRETRRATLKTGRVSRPAQK